MKRILLPAFTLLIFSCNSSKKESTETKNDTTAPAPPSTPPPGVEMTSAGKIDIESFGDIKIGQPYLETLKALGEPDQKSKATEWGADGLLHEDWTWTNKALVLNMSSEKTNVSGSMAVFSITAGEACSLKTKAGVGIGSTYDEIQVAYKNDINAEESTKEQVTVGSVYGGIIFTLRDNKVIRVFLGAAAE